jgi:hypothetical protein
MATVTCSVPEFLRSSLQKPHPFPRPTSEDWVQIVEDALKLLDPKHMRGFLYLPDICRNRRSSSIEKRIPKMSGKLYTAPYLYCTDIDDVAGYEKKDIPWSARYVLLSRDSKFYVLHVTWRLEGRSDENFSSATHIQQWFFATEIVIEEANLANLVASAPNNRLAPFPLRILYGLQEAQQETTKSLKAQEAHASKAQEELEKRVRLLSSVRYTEELVSDSD